MASRIGSGETERAVLTVAVPDDRVAVGAGADVVSRVRHVRCIAVIDHAGSARVAGEDPVVPVGRVDATRVRRGGGDVVAPPRTHADLARSVATVPPDLVALGAAAVSEEVADGQVLDVDAVGLEGLDAVTTDARHLLVLATRGARPCAGLGAIDDHPVATHPTQMETGGADQHSGRLGGSLDSLLVVITRSNKDPVAGLRSADRGLDRAELPGDPLVDTNPKHPRARRRSKDERG